MIYVSHMIWLSLYPKEESLKSLSSIRDGASKSETFEHFPFPEVVSAKNMQEVAWLVGDFKHFLFSISYMGCHPSHWRTHIFQDG